MLMFWLRYSFRTKWTNVTDESNTDHGEGMKSTVIHKASVNLLSVLFFPPSVFFSFFLVYYFRIFLCLSLSSHSSMCVFLLCLRVVFCFRRWWWWLLLLLPSLLHCIFSAAHSILRWTSTDVCTKEYMGKHTPVWLFFSFFLLYVVCVYIVHLM